MKKARTVGETSPIKSTRPLHLAVSGVPGAGKTTLAKQLAAELEIPYISLTDLIKKHRLFSGYNRAAKTYDVSIRRLESFLRKSIDVKKSYILDSHMSHLLSGFLVDRIVVCSCELGVLNRRLLARGYNKQKIRDNLDAQIFDVCYTEAQESLRPVLKIDCSRKVSRAQVSALSRKISRMH